VSQSQSHPVDPSRLVCSTCGYDLSGTAVGGKCPECGAGVAESIRVSSSLRSSSGGQNDSSPTVCLVFGLIGLVAGCTPLGFVAIWQYGVAKRAIAEGRAPSDQMTLATIGLVTGWIAIGLLVLQLAFVVFFFGLAFLGSF